MTTDRSTTPDVLYLHGFASSPGSAKARAFAGRLEPLGTRIVVPRLDGGSFARLTISRALAEMDAAAAPLREPYAVIGSSMGGYLALLHALRRPVCGVVAMAPAIDFPASWARWMPAAELARWRETGWTELDHHETGRQERIAYDIVRDSARHEVLVRAPSCPVLVFHGRRDDVVPSALSERFARENPHVRLRLLDDDHSLLASLPRILDEGLAFLEEFGTAR
jgi:pimeloyl-ACP methyl ester carboxylesterase